MKNRIIEVVELGFPKSLIQRENEPITELMETTLLVEELNQALRIHGVSISLRDKLEDFVAKYWYDNEYQHIDKQNHAKATESREKFRKWLDDNIEVFLKQ